MNKGTAALAIPILLGLIKKQGSSNDDELMSMYKKVYQRNQLLLKDKKRVSKYYCRLHVIWDQDEEEAGTFIDPPYTPTVPLNYDSTPKSIKRILDHCYLDEEECFMPYLNLCKVGIVLDFKITSDESWNGEIFKRNQIEDIIDNKDENPEDFLKMVHLYLIKKHDLGDSWDNSLPTIIEDIYNMGVPPHVGMKDQYEGVPYIPDPLSKEAYKVYKRESRCRNRGWFIDIVSDEILSDISELEPNDVVLHPEQGDYFTAELEFSSISSSLSSLKTEVEKAFNCLFWEWGDIQITELKPSNKMSKTRLRKR